MQYLTEGAIVSTITSPITVPIVQGTTHLLTQPNAISLKEGIRNTALRFFNNYFFCKEQYYVTNFS